MLMGAFFGICGADQFGSWAIGLVIAMRRRRRRSRSSTRSSRSTCAPTRSSAARRSTSSPSASPATSSSSIYGDQRHAAADASPRDPGRHDPRLPSSDAFFGPVVRPAQPDDLAELRRSWSSSYFVLFRTSSASASAPSASTRAPPTRSGSRSTRPATSRSSLSGMLAALGGAYLSIGFVALVQPEHDRGRGFIALAALIFGKWRPFGAFGGGAALRLLERARLPAPARTADSCAPAALPGAAVRPDAGRGRRRDRPLDPARRRWPPVREAVDRRALARDRARPAGRRRRCRVRRRARAAASRRPPARRRRSRSRSPCLRARPRSPARAARAAAAAIGALARRASRPRRPGSLGVAGLCVALSARSRSASTACSTSSRLRAGSRRRLYNQRADVRDRQQPPRGARPPGARLPQVELATKIRAQVPARPRGRAVRACCRRRRTSRASCARTPTTSASTAQLYVDEYNSRYVAGDATTTPQRRPRDPAGARAPTRRVVHPRALGIAALTALVIAAWKFGERRHDHGRRPVVTQPKVTAPKGLRFVGLRKGRISRSAAARRSARSSSRGRRPGDKQFIVGSRFWLACGGRTACASRLRASPLPCRRIADLHVVVTPSKTDRVTGLAA